MTDDEPGEPLIVRVRIEPDTEEEAVWLLGQRGAAEEGRPDAPHGEDPES